MRRMALLSMVVLTTACGVVEEKKDAAFRQLGKAALNGVIRLASSCAVPGAGEAARRQDSPAAVVAKAEPQPVPAPVVIEKTAVGRKTAGEIAAPVPQGEHGEFEFVYSRSEVPSMPTAPRHLVVRSDNAKHFPEEIEEMVKKARLEEHKRVAMSVRENAIASSRVAAAVLAEKPRQIARFEVLFAEQLEMASEVPPPPPAPAEPRNKACASQERAAS